MFIVLAFYLAFILIVFLPLKICISLSKNLFYSEKGLRGESNLLLVSETWWWVTRCGVETLVSGQLRCQVWCETVTMVTPPTPPCQHYMYQPVHSHIHRHSANLHEKVELVIFILNKTEDSSSVLTSHTC